jgi:hypothetical protein
MPGQDNSVCAEGTGKAEISAQSNWVESLYEVSHLAPLAGRGRPAKRSEVGRVRGDYPRARYLWRQPLSPPLSPRRAGRGSERAFLPHVGEILNDAADDRRARAVDGRDRVPVGPVRHGWRADPDRRAVDPDATADRDGAACDHADGLERLARGSMAGACPLVARLSLSDRLRSGCGRSPATCRTSRSRCSCSA